MEKAQSVTYPVTYFMGPKVLTKQPIQLWDSELSVSTFSEAYARDLQRALREWRDDDRIWLIPGASGVAHWYTRLAPLTFRECIIPSELFDIINIINIDEGKRLFPSFGLPPTWNNILPDGLYRMWLGAKPGFVPPPEYIVKKIPEFRKGKARFIKKKISFKPGSIIPIEAIEKDEGKIYLLWPPKGADVVPPVSPETKSEQYYGRLKIEADLDRNRTYVTTEKDPEMRAINYWLRWPAPFDRFFPTGGGLDILYHQLRMRNCIDLLNSDSYYAALQEAQAWVGRFTAEAEASLEKAWFLPKLVTNEEEALFAVEGRFDVQAASAPELAKSKRFEKERTTPIEVLRIHGWLGYFWWELYHDIKGRMTIKICQNCGGILRGGRADREYCSAEENPECSRRRSSLRQRKRRK